jgi:hypothetical protein
MKRHTFLLSFASLSLLLLVGCATPEARIKRNPELFSSLSPTVQEDVKKGVIKLGYTKDMVYLAAGKPNHVQTRLDKDGATTIWRYTAYRWTPDADVWPYRYGPWWYDPYYYRDGRQEYDVLRVEFRDDKVVAIEHIDR